MQPTTYSTRTILTLLAVFSLARLEAATVSGTIGVENGGQLLPYVVGIGGVSPDPLVLPEEGSLAWITSISGSGYSVGVSTQSWVASDFSSARGYVATLARSDPQNTAAWLLSVSLGSSEARSESLRMAIEAWMANSENGESPPWDIIESDRYRGRRGEAPQRLYGIGGEDSIPPVWTSGLTMTYDDGIVASVPESSSALLIVLGSLCLLTRRWRIPAHALS